VDPRLAGIDVAMVLDAIATVEARSSRAVPG
jgi:hypothetical protein